jgi:hypothetical protein
LTECDETRTEADHPKLIPNSVQFSHPDTHNNKGSTNNQGFSESFLADLHDNENADERYKHEQQGLQLDCLKRCFI